MRELWIEGLALKFVGLIIALVAFVLTSILPPPSGTPPYTIFNNIPAFLGGVAVIFTILGFALEILSYFAKVKSVNVSLIPEFAEISKSTLILVTVLAIVVASSVLAYFRIIPPEQVVNMFFFILGNIFGGVLSYYVSKRC